MELPPLIDRAALHAAGYSDAELRQLLRTGDLTSVRRGTYLCGGPPVDERVRHAVDARAALDRLADGAVCSHVTAAVLHGLPVWRIPLGQVHVTRPRGRSGGRSNARVRVHAASLDGDETCLVDGMPVTTLARTVADLARTVPFEEAVVVADGALHGDDDDPRREVGAARFARGATASGRPELIRVPSVAADRGPKRPPLERAALADALTRAERWRGARAARRAATFADGRSGSAGESRSRVALYRAGLPTPVLQWRVVDRAGRLIGYTDFGWPELATVGEFDGRVKYGRLLRPGQEPGDAVFAEKQREDRLRDQGLAVVRWTWTDLANFGPVASRLRSRFGC